MKEIEPGLADWRLRCSAFLLDYILTLLAPALALVLAVYVKRRLMNSTAATAIEGVGYLATAGVFFSTISILTCGEAKVSESGS